MMITLQNAKPTTRQIIHHLEEFERFCHGEQHISPSRFRDINQELSISAVLTLGKRRYQKDKTGRRLLWRGLDNKEYDLGLVNDAKITRHYPGYHGRHTMALAANLVKDSTVIRTKTNSTMSYVTLKDGSTGIGPDFRMAVRNAVLKMGMKKRRKFLNLSHFKSFFSRPAHMDIAAA